MVDDVSVVELRRMVHAAQRRAGKKISRNRKRGIELAGSEFDPRKAREVIERLNRRQLQSHLQRLEGFVSRGTQFVGLANGRPATRSEWERYKATEKAHREKAGKLYSEVKHVKLPTGETIEERRAKMDAAHKRMLNPAMNEFYQENDRKPEQITSRAALKTLEGKLKRDMRDSVMRAKVRDAKSRAAKALEVIGNPELTRHVEQLSQRQFVAMWNHTSFANQLFLIYAGKDNLMEDKVGDFLSKVMADAERDVVQLTSWARQSL